MIHIILIDLQLEFALEPFLYPQNVTLYDKYIEQVIIDLELMLRPQEAIKMNVRDTRSRSGVTRNGGDLTTKVGEQPWPQLVRCASIDCRTCGCVFQED